MSSTTHASIILARFDELRAMPVLSEASMETSRFCRVGADVRAAGTTVDSETAFKFVIFALHSDVESARAHLVGLQTLAPWLAEAKESWAGLLEPHRHFGEANFVDPAQPGPQFSRLGAVPPDSEPIVVITTAGWTKGNESDMDRPREFGALVSSVRAGMTAVPGLHSQQSFFLSGFLAYDGITVTFWDSFASMRDWAYGPGVHRNQVKRQREENLVDRSSFTRFRVLEADGTWHGSDPLRVTYRRDAEA